MNAPVPAHNSADFDRLFNGLLYSLMSWQQLTDFWPKIDTASGWYLYAVGQALPEAPANNSQVGKFIKELDALLRQEHRESYCGIVYADDLDNPNLVKIYDPNHLGSACGSSKTVAVPGWIMSRMPPRELAPAWIVPANRKRWWHALTNPAST
ncbi:MAG: hypothetical protein ACYC2R_04215 [Burkholderiales bacterium]|nr:hypothetical protein [Sulfuricellaceae bacterium]